jgi:hypothetical protein
MTKASDNDFPSFLLTEQGSAPTTPAASHQRLFIRTSDHTLCYVNSSGTVSQVSTAGVTLAYGSVMDSSGDHTISGTAFADVDTTHCGFSITTGARQLMVGWSGSVFPDGTRRLYLDIAIDGTRVANTTEGAFVSNTVANFFSGSFTLISGSALGSGSHTVRLQARQSAGSGAGTIAGGSSGSPVGFLWAMEMSS